MTTGLVTHEACLQHLTPAGHPERVARLTSVLEGLEAPEFAGLKRITAPCVTREALLRAHDASLIDTILSRVIRPGHFIRIDADTAMSAGSIEAAKRAAGAVVEAVDQVVSEALENAFCAVRPPGHHAERSRAMGFCLFNNVAIGALHARAAHGLRRIAVVDFDVHHGNGTQDIFFNDAELFYASSHQFPLYPGTGDRSERGIAGNIFNEPLPPGSGGDAFRNAFRTSILPALERFAPQFLFISAGFDAHEADPLASLRLNEGDFEWATRELCTVAGRLCDGRVVSVLEGGYDLGALARSSAAHARALMGKGET